MIHTYQECCAGVVASARTSWPRTSTASLNRRSGIAPPDFERGYTKPRGESDSHACEFGVPDPAIPIPRQEGGRIMQGVARRIKSSHPRLTERLPQVKSSFQTSKTGQHFAFPPARRRNEAPRP